MRPRFAQSCLAIEAAQTWPRRIAGDRQRHRRREIARVSLKPAHTDVAERASHRVTRPGTTFCSSTNGKPARDRSPHGRRARSTAESDHGRHVLFFEIPAGGQIAGDIVGDKSNRIAAHSPAPVAMALARRRTRPPESHDDRSRRPPPTNVIIACGTRSADEPRRPTRGRVSRRAATGEHNVRWARHEYARRVRRGEPDIWSCNVIPLGSAAPTLQRGPLRHRSGACAAPVLRRKLHREALATRG